MSILETFEQLNMTQMEMQVLQHRASLTPAQHAANDARSAPVSRQDMPPLEVTHIGPDDIKKLPYMMQPGAAQPQGGSGEMPIVNKYKDPYGAQK